LTSLNKIEGKVVKLANESDCLVAMRIASRQP